MKEILGFFNWSLLDSVVQSYESVTLTLEVSEFDLSLAENLDRRNAAEEAVRGYVSNRTWDGLRLIVY